MSSKSIHSFSIVAYTDYLTKRAAVRGDQDDLERLRRVSESANRMLRFEETYGEVRVAPGPEPRVECTLYLDHSFDEFDFVSDRDTYGGSGTVRLPASYSATLELARQDATGIVAFGRPPSWSDHFVSFEAARAGWGTAALQWERTNDPYEEDPSSSVDPQAHPLTFASGTVTADIGEHFAATLFVGKRRGGSPARRAPATRWSPSRAPS